MNWDTVLFLMELITYIFITGCGDNSLRDTGLQDEENVIREHIFHVSET